MGWSGALVLLLALAACDAVAAAPAFHAAHRPHAARVHLSPSAPTLPVATEAVSAPSSVGGGETCTPTMAGSNRSPDGAWFAFECRVSREAQPYLKLARTDGSQVWRYDVNWQTLEAVGQTVTGAILPFHWSESGRWVYAALSADRDDGPCGVLGKGQTVIRVELTTGTGQVLLQGTPAFARFEAAVSRDDQFFMYALNGARQFDPRVMDLKTGEIVTYALDDTVGQIGHTSWSPDGSVLITLTAAEFCRTQSNHYQLAILDRGSRTTRLIELPVADTPFTPIEWIDAVTVRLTCDCGGGGEDWVLDVPSGRITALP